MSDARLEAWLTFIAAIAGAIAWPILLGIVFLTIREPLARLIGRVSMVSWSEGRAEFGAALQKGVEAAAAVATAEAAGAVVATASATGSAEAATTNTVAAPDAEGQGDDVLTRQLEQRLAATWPDELLQLQIVSPRAKQILMAGGPLPWDRVRNSWTSFERSMIRIVEIKLGLRPRNVIEASTRLLKHKLIDFPVAELVLDVHGLWELASQPGTSVPPKEADSFQLLAAKVLQLVLNKTSGPEV